MPNQWKFNEALSNAGSAFANAIYRNQERDQRLADEERRKAEDLANRKEYYNFIQSEKNKQDLADQQKIDANNKTILNLLMGGQNEMVGQTSYDPNNALATQPRQEKFVPYDKTRIAQILSGMSPQDINKFQDIQKQINPVIKPKEYTNYKFNMKDGIYAINKATSQLEKVQEGNPLYTPDRLSTVTGYEKNGRQVMKIFYDDGSNKSIPTGFYKDEKGTEKFNPEDANKSLTHYSDEYAKLQRLKSAYENNGSPMLRDALNTQIGDTENQLYNFLDSESRDFINQNYEALQKTAQNKGLTLEQYEAQYPDAIKQKFQDAVAQNYKGTKTDYAHKRALILWSNFKYGYAR